MSAIDVDSDTNKVTVGVMNIRRETGGDYPGYKIEKSSSFKANRWAASKGSKFFRPKTVGPASRAKHGKSTQ